LAARRARAHQPAMPLVGVYPNVLSDSNARYLAAFRNASMNCAI